MHSVTSDICSVDDFNLLINLSLDVYLIDDDALISLTDICNDQI